MHRNIWNTDSKRAFVQALNIEFLTTTGSYTNFRFAKEVSHPGHSYIYMLFSNGEQKKCQKYLEEVTAKYRGAIKSLEKSNFYANSFPFCISSGQFSNDKRGTKFKVSLNEEIINNLYYVFIFQLLSFEMNVTNLPGDLDLKEYEKGKGYITGWIFSQERGGHDLEQERILKKLLDNYGFKKEVENVIDEYDILNHCVYIHKHRANRAVQKAIQDFPAELLRQYPQKLLILFNIFYHYMYKYSTIGKVWNGVDRVKAYGETVRLYKAVGFASNEDKKNIEIINDLYKDKDFCMLAKDTELSFNFSLCNINTIMAKVPCDIDYVKKARELAGRQYVGTTNPICVVDPSSTPEIADNTASSSSKQSFSRVSSKSNYVAENKSLEYVGLTKSNESDDSTLKKPASSPLNTSSESHPNCKSLDSGYESEFIRNAGRSKSVPLSMPNNVLSAAKARKSLDDISRMPY